MTFQRSLPSMAAVAVLALVLTACSGNTPADAPGETDAPASPAPTAAVAPSPSPNAEAQLLKGTGIFVGQIDNHSVEIETKEGPTAFELGEGLENAADDLNTDDPVAFEYVEKAVGEDPSVKQRVLSKLVLIDDEGASQPPAAGTLPETKVMKLSLEGSEEEKTAKLATADGYALYVFDIFSFDAPNNKLAMKVDDGYYAEITKLPSDFNLDYLKEEGTEALKETGEVLALEGDKRPEAMADARLYLSAAGSKLTRQYIVKEIEGQGYVFVLNIPQREASEGFGPHVFASLNSIVTRQ
ncbi:hypothetical protein J7E73_00230 [Paenibacillus albidus]|uniref:hypothetical protein n=1 Tax=Paenibacillus albidus TaxID=2041023 RepID=UPI001BE5C05E|nr:hypothetical protein [Paenibacillus albidus]MBT2287582.1 hypothetical protein [Paenibacillus albidus]